MVQTKSQKLRSTAVPQQDAETGPPASKTRLKGRLPRSRSHAASGSSERSSKPDAQSVLTWLARQGKKSVRHGMDRYGIPQGNAFGVAISTLRQKAKQLGRSHELALALWDTGQYEARMLAAFVGEPGRLTSAQMDRWAKDFDNWAVCDHACFHLFDRTPHAWGRVEAWSGRRNEFVKRAAFALLWGLTVHDKAASDAQFVYGLSLIERAATDERHYVQKAVNMALRATGKRKPSLRAPAITVAQRLAESSSEAARWVGRDALRELSRLKSRT